MKTQRNNKEQVLYEAPEIEFMELVTEGVLCGSNPFVNLQNGGENDEFLN